MAQNQYIDNLEVGDTETEYVFYNSPEVLITVIFTKWKEDTIKKAEFTIHRSDNKRLLYRAVKCVADPGSDTHKLSLHSLFINDNPQVEQTTKKLKIKNLNIPSQHKLKFIYIKYGKREQYDKQWSCVEEDRLTPDIVEGGILKRP